MLTLIVSMWGSFGLFRGYVSRSSRVRFLTKEYSSRRYFRLQYSTHFAASPIKNSKNYRKNGQNFHFYGQKLAYLYFFN